MAHFALTEKNTGLVVTVLAVANDKLLDTNNVEQESLGIQHLQRVFASYKWPINERIKVDEEDIPILDENERFILINDGYYNNTDLEWVQTSYHGNKRFNFAAKGHRLDKTLNAFIAPKPTGKPLPFVGVEGSGHDEEGGVIITKGQGNNIPVIEGEWVLDENMKWVYEEKLPLLKEVPLFRMRTTGAEAKEGILNETTETTTTKTLGMENKEKNTFKRWTKNRDVRILSFVSLLFWWFRFYGTFIGTVYKDIDGASDIFATIMFTVLTYGVGYAIPTYLVVHWIHFRKTGKWL